MEQHLADLQKAQKKKRAFADARAVELGNLRAPQASQELPNEVHGTLAGTSISGGAAGLERVVGAGKAGAGKAGAGRLEIIHHEGEGMAGAGVVSDLRIPIISDIARLFGLGKKGKKAKKQGRKAREDERLGMEVKGLKDKMKMKKGGAYVDPMFGVVNTPKMDGGAYIDPMFSVINQPAGSSAALEQVAGEAPMGSGYKGGAREQGEKMAKYMMELHGHGYAKEFHGGFWGILASLAAPLVGKLLGQGKMKGGVHTDSEEELAIMEREEAPEVYERAYSRRMMEMDPAYLRQHREVAERQRLLERQMVAEGARMDQMRREMEAMRAAQDAQARAAPRPELMAAANRRIGMDLPAAAGATAVAASAPAGAPAPTGAPAVGILGEMVHMRRASPKMSGNKRREKLSSSESSPSSEMEKKEKKEKKPRGGMAKAGDRRAARAAIVKQVMQEKGLSLPKASQYVKANNLF